MIKILIFIIFGKQCKHDWKQLASHFIKSDIERAMEVSPNFSGRGFGSSATLVQIFSCNKCGKIYKSVEQS